MNNFGNVIKGSFGFIVFVFVIIFGFNCWTTIPAGQVGVQTLFGQTRSDILMPGFHFINPLLGIHPINIRASTISDGSQGATSDLQNVDTNLTMVYSINPLNAVSLYNVVGNSAEYLSDGIIKPAMSEAFKASIAQYNAPALIDSRSKVSTKVKNQIIEKLARYGIEVQMVSITGFNFSKDFSASVEASARAKQDVETLKQKLLQATIESQIAIVKATATAQATKIQAQTITPEMLILKWIEKWDGAQSKTSIGSCSGSSLPVLPTFQINK